MSSSTALRRRILHQPFLPQDSPPSPPPIPSPPSPPADGNSPFFPSSPYPPPPPSPASFASFPANISSLAVPHPSKPGSASSKLIAVAVAAVIAAVAIVSLAVFVHLRKRNRARGRPPFCQSKAQRSDSGSTTSFNQTPYTHHIPKLQRPSQTSSEFLYLGTLVSSHAAGGGAAFNGGSSSTANHNNASNPRKTDSPELRPLPMLSTQQGFRRNSRNNADVISSKDDESEEFYSPKGSINGMASSIGTGSASRRAFAAIELENFDGSKSDSSSTYSSSVRGSGSGSGSASPVRSASSSFSPANNSMPKSPDLIEIQNIASLPPPMPSPPDPPRGLLFRESESPSPPSSSSPERYSRRSEESSHRTSNVSNLNEESLGMVSSPVQYNTTVIPIPPESRGLGFLESPAPLPPDRCSRRSEDSSPRNSDASDQRVESPVRISSPVQCNTTDVPRPLEIRGLVLPVSPSPLPPSSFSPERSSRRSENYSPKNLNVSDQKVESPVRISSPVQCNTAATSTPPEIRGLVLPESPSLLPPSSFSLERNWRSEDYTPRNSNVSDQKVESPVRISSPLQCNTAATPTTPEIRGLVLLQSESLLPLSSSSPERCSRRIEDPSSENVESPVGISSPLQHNTAAIPAEMQVLVLPESASPRPLRSSSPEKHSMKSYEPSPRNAECPMGIGSHIQHNATVISASQETPGLAVQKSAPPSPLSPSSPERNSRRSEESSPRISYASDQNADSPVRISSTMQDEATVIPKPQETRGLVIQEIAPPSPEKSPTRSEESMMRTSNDSDKNVESTVRINSPVQHNATVIPTPPPPPLPPVYPPLLLPSPTPPVSTPTPAPPPVAVPPPPPPPPLPTRKAWESPRTPTPPAEKPLHEPPALKTSLSVAFESPALISPIELPPNDLQTTEKGLDKEFPGKETKCSSEAAKQNGESPPKPKLKPLHWDKVRASSDREMVWDQLKCSSFKLNEEMIETLFVANTVKPSPKETTRWQVLPPPGQDNGNRVLDSKKAQNIAILLKALHVTVDEVCEGLLEGNIDILGAELLESLLKMAPTKEEEQKLKAYKDDSPVKLGTAERFVKAVIDIPYAFRRIEAMIYVSNFESEVEYLKKSFSTLEAACEELRTNRVFLKLLEAVLKTGNRMNVGTNRGDAHAFKLDTLLKLVDVKGADGKTTLLHFVVQEMLRSEGARLSGGSTHENSSINDDAKCRRLGLQLVSALSSGLSNVKKAAVMDAEVLNSDFSKLTNGIRNIRDVVRLSETLPLEGSSSHKFAESMNSFVGRAEEEICRIQAQEMLALSLVKEITEYFHGNSAKEEAHPFRIFMVVREFLTILDRVCKEVAMINERTMVSSAHRFPVPINPMLQQVSGGFHNRQCTSSDDESLPFNV